MRYFLAAVIVGLSFSSVASAGITIHFEGTARNHAAVAEILKIARAEAQVNHWSVEDASVSSAQVSRIIDEQEHPYTGPLTGVVISPGVDCEPLYIQFGSDLFMQDFVKTQFAGPGVHIAVVNLLRKIEPLFQELTVIDEGDYWDSNDRATLKQQMKVAKEMIEAFLARNPRARTKVRTPEGRIIDIIQ